VNGLHLFRITSRDVAEQEIAVSAKPFRIGGNDEIGAECKRLLRGYLGG